MTFLVDTNVLLRLAISQDGSHKAARQATEALRESGQDLFTTSQNLIETWNVATRPSDRNGLGHTPDEASELVDRLERGFPRLADPVDLYERWRLLVAKFSISGVQVHDARIVAVMLSHDVTNILTFNTRDFRRYEAVGIQATDPKSFSK